MLLRKSENGGQIYYVLQFLSDYAVSNMHKFAAASTHEAIAFGAAKPGYPDALLNFKVPQNWGI
jgi:hypothetical protein